MPIPSSRAATWEDPELLARTWLTSGGTGAGTAETLGTFPVGLHLLHEQEGCPRARGAGDLGRGPCTHRLQTHAGTGLRPRP